MTVMRDHPCQPLTGYVSMDDGERIARVTAFRALMAARRTVRDFSDRPVPRAVVEQALLTAGSAPSGANHQPWFFSVIESASARGRIRAAAEAEERAFYAPRPRRNGWRRWRRWAPIRTRASSRRRRC